MGDDEPRKQLPLQQRPSRPLQESVKILSSAIVIPPNIWKITGALAAAKPGAHHPQPRIPPGRQECDGRIKSGWQISVAVGV